MYFVFLMIWSTLEINSFFWFSDSALFRVQFLKCQYVAFLGTSLVNGEIRVSYGISYLLYLQNARFCYWLLFLRCRKQTHREHTLSPLLGSNLQILARVKAPCLCPYKIIFSLYPSSRLLTEATVCSVNYETNIITTQRGDNTWASF